MKKVLLIFVVVALMLMPISAMALNKDCIEVDIYDECVKVSGYLPYAQVNDVVSLLVLNQKIDIEEYDDFNTLPDIVVYHGETNVDSSNQYQFIFTSATGGKHYVYLASSAYSDVMTKEYSYISKSKFDALPTDSQSNLLTYMKANKVALGLDESIYNDSVISDMVNLIFSSTGYDRTMFSENLEKGYVISMLNSGGIGDISNYKHMISLEKTDYNKYPPSNTVSFTNALKSKGFTSIESFDNYFAETILVYAINSSSENGIKSIISENSGKFGTASVSNGLASAIKNAAPFASIAGIKAVITSYVQPAAPTGGDTTGVGTGTQNGGGGSPGAYVNTSVVLPQGTINVKNEFSPFDDIVNVSWAKDAIINLYHNGIISGKEQRKFYPNDMVTRSEFAKMVTSSFKLNLLGDSFPFEDITEDNWAYRYIKTAYLAGITSGYDATHFGGENNITREDICVMVYRAFLACDVPMIEKVDKNFIDENEISDYAKEAVLKLTKCGIISGDENGKFNPSKNATRAESAVILNLSSLLVR